MTVAVVLFTADLRLHEHPPLRAALRAGQVAREVGRDIVNNQLNWQWVAGTGTDTRPHRVLNPVVQGKRFDAQGTYVRRWVPELRDVHGKAVHEPWRHPAPERARLDYPEPLVDLADGLARFRHARGRG
jgi:deoxyribodipyrimidine photo-lyase